MILSYATYGQKTDDIAIAFYNCENLFGTQHKSGKSNPDFTPEGRFHYDDKTYKEKLHNIARVLYSMDEDIPSGPAIIGLAEVENEEVLNDLISEEGLKDHNYRFISFDAPDKNGLDLALLYKPGIFSPLSSYTIPVSYKQGSLRDILYVKGLLRGDTVHILVNYWSSGRTGDQTSGIERFASAKTCRGKVDSIFKASPNAKIIVMGDLNTNPSDSLLPGVLAARSEKYATSATDLYNPWLNIYKSGRGSLEYLDHWDLYDQILLSASFLKTKASLHYEKAIIFKKDFMVDHNKRFLGYPHSSFAGTMWINGYSDHFPIMLYLTAY